MCLAVPARVVSMEGSSAMVDVAGNRREADLSLLEDVRPGDYVLVHAGFAIGRYDEEEARATLALWREMAELAEREGGREPGDDREGSG